ncbi:hypothetical protein D0T21_28480 [Duganella sp. BJB476]|nr:hypothetical protein D0T21_28480 [Duganella sp. BJB476]
MFTVLRDALKVEKLPLGQGWGDVIANATESTTQGERYRKFLRAYFAESTITGERYVQLFDVADDDAKQIAAQIQGATANSPTFGSTYPLPIPQDLLASASSEPELCEVRLHDSGDFSLIFCSARWHDDKNAYEAKELPKHVLDTYNGIDKLVTYRKVYYQAYDVVTLRVNLGRIEVCIEAPTKAKKAEIEGLPLKVLSACALHIAKFKGMGAKPPENLFPAIAGMYYHGTEGKVMGLAFRTMTGSIKKERMTPDNVDLRNEKFHHAGMNALGQKISPYELTLDYEMTTPSTIATLKLAALIRELSSATPTLHGCYVTSTSFSAFEHTLNRLVTYIY